MVLGPLSTTMQVLASIGVDLATLAKIEQVLESGSGEIRANEPIGVPAGAVGGSSAARSLEQHSQLAHQVLLEALTELEQHLTQYRHGVRDFQQLMFGADENAGADLARRMTALSQQGDDV